MTPPTFKDLLTDPVFKKFVMTNPRMPEAATLTPHAWVIYAHLVKGTWARVFSDTYKDALTNGIGLLKRESVRDISIVSRRVSFKPPVGFNWLTHSEWDGAQWCVRCRRPSLFEKDAGLHALMGSPFILPAVTRCYFCGSSHENMPAYLPDMGKKSNGQV